MKVKDRSVVTTADAETRAVTPEGLQSRIKADVAATPSGVFNAMPLPLVLLQHSHGSLACIAVWPHAEIPVNFSKHVQQ